VLRAVVRPIILSYMKRFLVFLAVCALACALVLALASGGSPTAFVAGENPFVLVLWLTAAFAASCFAFGAATGDYSWVDRLWSILPPLFAWIYAARGSFGWPVTVGAVLVTVWGIRLTRNFARRGGYAGEEDYRWSVLRSRIPSGLLWQLFNAAFICAFQLGVIALFSSPLSRLAEAPAGGVGPGAAFITVALLPLLFLAFETEADREQWSFQARKAAARAAGAAGAAGPAGAAGAAADKGPDDEAAKGFCSSGLFRLSRHPAYFGELGFWWSIYLLCAVGSGSLVHWSLAGPVALTCIFIGSTGFTESISMAKYPAYADYRRMTSPVVPWFPKRGS
jgi:steroid 5-alpha reductase family enzyme